MPVRFRPFFEFQNLMNRWILVVLWTFSAPGLHAQPLKVATINVWSGLDYAGVFSMGEYEPDSVRHTRLSTLLDECKNLQADILFLQECNPVDAVASFFAEGLGYERISQRVNGGFKIGPLGFPVNLDEGLVILAKPELHLTFFDVWDLSPRFGAFGDFISLHFEDQNAALVGTVTMGGTTIALVNLHLSSAVADDSLTRAMVAKILTERGVNSQTGESVLGEFSELARIRIQEVERLLHNLNRLLPEIPVIVGGDFNATSDAVELQNLASVLFSVSSDGPLTTWDPVGNPNIRFSAEPATACNILETLKASYDGVPRQIDHIFLGGGFVSSDVQSVALFANTPHGGRYPSDHYGLIAAIDHKTIRTPVSSPVRSQTVLEALPILTYDTDVGFGYGGKGFLLNALGESESFDLVIFNSTKGEQWYRLVASVPDFELRQGTRYPFSFDLIVDYDQYLKNNFFGIGQDTRKEEGETYTKKALEIQMLVSRGFTERIVGQAGLKFKSVRNLGYQPSGIFAAALPGINHGHSQGLTLFASLRYDSRNSYINPSRGNVVRIDLEKGTGEPLSDYGLESGAISLQTYHTLFYPKTVLAARVMAQSVGGSNLPVHLLPSLGGNRTLRGYPQDRFIDNVAIVSNVEVRFPIVWRFDGLIFYDAGKVAPRWNGLQFGHGWKTNVGIGLRFIMETFVVRADLGLSEEGSGFYFNFGHLF